MQFNTPASRLVFCLLVIGLTAVVTYGFEKIAPPKSYTVSLPVDKWNIAMQTMNNAREIMKKSTLPSNVVSEWTDSLTSVQMEMSSQIQDQMRKDGTLPSLEEMQKHSTPIDEKLPTDSTKTKPSKK